MSSDPSLPFRAASRRCDRIPDTLFPGGKPDRGELVPPAANRSRQTDAAVTREILVIDDDPAILQTLLLLFRESGYDPVGFSDPLDALMWASDADPTCIVVDLKLPGVEGLDLVAAFCALGRHAVVLISAFVDVTTTVDAMRLGVDNVIQKPTNPDVLIAAVKRGLEVLKTAPRQELMTLTRRERQVAELIVAGRTTKQIAQTLSLSPRTVEFFRGSLLRKTQSTNSAALASTLTLLGFHPPG